MSIEDLDKEALPGGGGGVFLITFMNQSRSKQSQARIENECDSHKQ